MKESLQNKINDLLLERKESERFDIKMKYYDESKKYDMVKDVVAFANNSLCEDKYIVFGINDNDWSVCGIDRNKIPNISDIEQLINEKVEPKLKIKLDFIELQAHELAVLTICKENNDRPYVVTKSVGSSMGKPVIHKGMIYIRNGATNSEITRRELDTIYATKQNIRFTSIGKMRKKILSTAKGIKNFLTFEIRIDNYLSYKYDVCSAWLRVSIEDSIFLVKECICTVGEVSTKDKFILDDGHVLSVPAYSSTVRLFNFKLSESVCDLLNGKNAKFEILINFGKNEQLIEL